MTSSKGRFSRLEYWSAFIRENGFKSCAEVGVWKGDFSARMLSECDGVSEYVMIDSWRHLKGWDKPFNVSDEEFEEIHGEALRKTDFAKDRRRVLRGTMLEVESQIPPSSLDFVYIDGDHTLRGIVIDSIIMWEKLREGGVLAGDDHARSIWQHGRGYEPSLVNPFMSYFAEAVGCRLEEVGDDQFLIRKMSRCGDPVVTTHRPLLPLILERGNEDVILGEARSVFRTVSDLALKLSARLSTRMRERLRRKQGVHPMPEAVRKAGILLIHIPKNAGTSLSHALYGEDIGHLSLKVWTARYPHTVRRMATCAVIRDPVGRFISAFHFLKGGGLTPQDAEFSRIHLARHDSPESLVEAMSDPVVRKGITSYYHFIPQTSFLKNRHGHLAVKILIPYSRLSDEEYLKSVFGWEFSLPCLNVTQRPSGSDTITEDAANLIRKYYAEDQRLHVSLASECTSSGH